MKVAVIVFALIIITVNSDHTSTDQWTQQEIDTINRVCNRICWIHCTLTSRTPFPCENGVCHCSEIREDPSRFSDFESLIELFPQSLVAEPEAVDIILVEEFPTSSCDFQFCQRSCFLKHQRAMDESTCDANENCICS